METLNKIQLKYINQLQPFWNKRGVIVGENDVKVISFAEWKKNAGQDASAPGSPEADGWTRDGEFLVKVNAIDLHDRAARQWL
jgi:hypothetical protein